MAELSCRDYAQALRLLSRLEDACGDPLTFSRQAVQGLAEFITSDLASLSVCDLRTAPAPQPPEEAAPQNAPLHFLGPPLVCCRGKGTERGMPPARDTPAGSAPHQETGPGPAPALHLLALPVHHDAHMLVSFVVHRHGADFSDRERQKLELLRPHLAFLYRQSCRQLHGEALAQEAARQVPALTRREADVLGWLACGKTDKDIAMLLDLSPRTVHKHLEHIYAKLGVETRTAAVMRAAAFATTRPG